MVGWALTIKKSLNTKKIDVVIVPGECTKYIQVPDVSWNKTLKVHCTERYDDWLTAEGIHKETGRKLEDSTEKKHNKVDS